MSIIVALLVFSFIVFIHELGHFYFARRGGIAVEEFAIGMGPKLFGFERNGTIWSVRALPIGGYCKMLGENGDEENDKPSGEGKKLNGDPFYAKSVWIRISAVIGGPLFNFILAFIFSLVLVSLSTVSSLEVAYVEAESPAAMAGIQVGDKLVSIDGHRLIRPKEASIYINVPAGEPVTVTVERDAEDGEKENIEYVITPMVIEMNPNVDPEDSENYYMIGIGYGIEEKGLINTIRLGVLETLSWVKVVIYSLVLMISGQVSMTALSGPVALVSTIGSDYEQSLAEGIKVVVASMSFWIVLISSNLGVINLLPIPALDGGRLIFLFGEVIMGRPIAPEKEGYIHFIGFALLMALMLFVMYNDIMRVFGLG